MQKRGATSQNPPPRPHSLPICHYSEKSAVKILKFFHEDFRDFLRILHQFLSVGIAQESACRLRRGAGSKEGAGPRPKGFKGFEGLGGAHRWS